MVVSYLVNNIFVMLWRIFKNANTHQQKFYFNFIKIMQCGYNICTQIMCIVWSNNYFYDIINYQAELNRVYIHSTISSIWFKIKHIRSIRLIRIYLNLNVTFRGKKIEKSSETNNLKADI